MNVVSFPDFELFLQASRNKDDPQGRIKGKNSVDAQKKGS